MTTVPDAHARTRIKICGLTRAQDVDAAVAAGADAVGFVRYAKSLRHVSMAQAVELAHRLPPFVTPVLLYVNEAPETVAADCSRMAHALVQFHGDETPQQCLIATGNGARAFVRAARIPLGEGAAHFDLVKYADDFNRAHAILLDAHVAGYGGAGKTFNWSLLPPSVNCHLVLSGGLTPANVTDGILQVRPRCKTLAVDVSSGVEMSQGIKDADKIHQFVAPCVPPTDNLRNTSMYEYQQPDPSGHFGIYGGSFVGETLTHAIGQLQQAYARYQHDPAFIAEFNYELAHFVGRPSAVYHAARMSREQGGAQIYLKREDLNHTGAHKVNNTIGQAMLARRMGKQRVIAETGAGQHGVATATICARYGLECVVYMGSEDIKRQSPNVYRMKLLGATVVPVESGSRTLKDALNEAMRDWVANVDNTFYIIGTVAGPHPYPTMVRDFQSVIGLECLQQMPKMLAEQGCHRSQPDAVVACVGGGSNAMGIFHPYIAHSDTRLIGVEAAGEGLDSGKHSASLQRGSAGVLHGNRTYVLQNDDGQVTETHSISAGLDYPGVGPEHAFLKDSGRAQYVGITDTQALEAFHYLCRTEGIIPALESSHAVAYAMQLARTMRTDQSILVNLSGRGDKDIGTVADLSNADFYCRPSCMGQGVKGGASAALPVTGARP